jgi:NAD(P)-dependent dehydrogenase (short-subunit alcohol dehydrogenase family)
MAKFAIEGLTKSMAMDLGKYGIRVNSVSPTKTIIDNKEIKNKKKLNIIKNKIPLGKFSTTNEIANIVYFLTTKNANSITGTSIISDGGWTAGK